MELLSILLFLLVVLAVIGIAAGLVGLLFKKFRQKAKRLAGVSLLLFVVAIFAGVNVDGRINDRKAQEKGFESETDKSAATNAGFKNAPDWLAHKKAQAEQAAAQTAKAKADEAARQAETKALAAKRFAEAKAAGFENVEDYNAATAAGISNAVQWQKRKEITARLDRLKDGDSSILSVQEDMVLGENGLFVRIKTAGRDGGSWDFRSFASTVSRLAAHLRKEQTPYVWLRVGLVVPVLDKYGNAEDANGGDINWRLSELAKVNLDAGPDFLLQAAGNIGFRRFGGEMARAYCKDNPDFRDPRYCVRGYRGER